MTMIENLSSIIGPAVEMRLSVIVFAIGLVSGVAYAQKALPPPVTVSPMTKRVEALLKQMTLDEKIGQMVQPVKDISPDDIKNFFIGSVLSGGGGSIGNLPSDWADSYDRFQQAALSTRLKIPIIYGLDAVHGHNNVRGAVLFPHHIGLGAARDPELMFRLGKVVAEEVLTTGPTWTFAPCLAVPRDERWGRTFEGFGEDPELGRILVGNYIKGMQTPDFNGRHLVACLKHWVADGGTKDGKNAGDSILTDKELDSIHIAPYIPGIRAGAWTVMVSYNSINGVPCHVNKKLITEVLKGKLGFKGIVVSDWLGIGGRYVDAINAVIDMAMEPTTWRQFITAV
ncbi:MAG: glycoside hydrolase family 3 N-terminal domain-containing protein, partial [bacterium]